ncbi:hypothetical protein [Calderihabitans maritimus]|uniref:Glutamate synthase subunit alpha domain-containing protein n=1 Tax=Calderihabitans maritimus TaxID=1246530 RepID=A0A1Z5HR55_9FIRM|nr:hypothetical protein [Calderihabitans maritimus]GAW92009.1 glutamate synthase subunit alpha domain-containing protein [Calderihabitans maritimus]
MVTIDAKGIYYKDLNEKIKEVLANGAEEIRLLNVNGQRYIGDCISGRQRIIIEGTPGNDMAAYMDGLELIVKGNAQDGVGNTMNGGTVVIHGDAGDITGYAMRGGEIYIRGNVGYRVGIHMKEYKDQVPVIVIGGTAGDFLGEYMAGGIIIVLGLNVETGQEVVGNFCGTGMHGGVMYIRGEIQEYQLGKEVKVLEPTDEDYKVLEYYVGRFCQFFDLEAEPIWQKKFRKLIPYNKRPYGNLYTRW